MRKIVLNLTLFIIACFVSTLVFAQQNPPKLQNTGQYNHTHYDKFFKQKPGEDFGHNANLRKNHKVDHNYPVAQYKGKKVYKGKHGEYGGHGKLVVHQWHHIPVKGKSHIIVPQGAKYYAVDPTYPAFHWLNRNIRGDIYQEGAHIYHSKTGEYLGYVRLMPGVYHLNFTKYKQIPQLDGYKALKKEMGDRVVLLRPHIPGHWVGIQILQPKYKKK